MWAKPSIHSNSGGRPGSLSSRMMSVKMGHAVSGSEAPMRARRAREMLGAMGMGMSEGEGGCESWSEARTGLERARALRREAV